MAESILRIKTCGVLLAAAVALSAGAARPQLDPASSVVDPEAGAAAAVGSVAASLRFDVVSIRRVTVPSDHSAIQSRPDGDSITITNLGLKAIIEFAFDFQRPDLVSGLPDWVSNENYDIIAKVSESDLPKFRKLDQAQRRAMLRQLLHDRFQLEAHTAPKEIPVYALTVAKNGPKLKEARPGETYANGARNGEGGPAGAGTITPSSKGLVGQGAEIRQLVVLLSRLQLGRQVVDRTGLEARYDFVLQFSPTEAMRPVINGQHLPPSAEQEAMPSVFTAVQEQLGLRLEPAKAMVEGLVIDHLERPSEN